MTTDSVDRPELISEIVRRVVAVAHPDKIILFGSAARGDVRAHSDIDVLIVKSGDFHKGRLTGVIYRSLYGMDASVDVIVVKPEDIEKYRDCPYTVIRPALREGRVIYAA